MANLLELKGQLGVFGTLFPAWHWFDLAAYAAAPSLVDALADESARHEAVYNTTFTIPMALSVPVLDSAMGKLNICPLFYMLEIAVVQYETQTYWPRYGAD